MKFIDLARENAQLEDGIEAATRRVVRSGSVLYGPELDAFEAELAEWFGVKYAVGVASGTDAVEIALRCVGAERVTCPAFTAIPCANAIEAAGADIVLADVCETGNGIGLGGYDTTLAVSMLGRACQVDDTMGPVVEDIAHSMGAVDNRGMVAGTRGVVGAVSFYPTKILGAIGDGGAIITNERGIYERAKQIRHYGVEGEGVTIRGQNSRLCEIQAAILRLKLPMVRGWIARRRAIARVYTAELRNATIVQPIEEGDSKDGMSVYHVFVVRHPERDRVRAALAARGIPTMVHYDKAIHQHPRWRRLGYEGAFPMAETLAREVISLPCYPYLTQAEQDAVIDAWNEVA